MKELNNLNYDEIKNLYENNQGFRAYVDECIYNDMMVEQSMEADNLGASVLNYHDHYNSFYLTTPMVNGAKAPELVAGGMAKDYMNKENAELYDKLCKLNDEWESMDYDEQDENSDLYNEMIDTCDALAEGITEQLRAYESVSDETIEYELQNMLDNECFTGWTTDGTKVYQTITKEYK